MEIVGLLADESGLSVSEIQKKLKKSGRDLAYTTVMTVLSRLFSKGTLGREKSGRQYLYSRNAQTDHAGINVISNVRDTLFKNEGLKPILTLLDGYSGISRKELLELRKVVEKKLKEGK